MATNKKIVKRPLTKEEQDILDLVTRKMGSGRMVVFPASDSMAAKIYTIPMRFEVLYAYGNYNVSKSPNGDVVVSKSLISAPAPDANQNPAPAPIKHTPKPQASHTYYPPDCAADIRLAVEDKASRICWLLGPTQAGKSRLVAHIGEQLKRKVWKITCRGDMDSVPFYGEKTVDTVVDADGKSRSVVKRVKGIVELAMTEGVDADGVASGSPAILFIDEAASLPAHIGIGLNSLFESDDPVRKLHLDDGTVIKSHPGFRIILASNTNGRGATTMRESMYTAQTNAQDLSLSNRVDLYFRIGYDRRVEHKVMMELIDDEAIVKKLEDFRDAIREAIRAGEFQSPISTKKLIAIAHSYRVFGDLGKALNYSLIEYLNEDEREKAIECARLKMDVDIRGKFQDKFVDYE